jgi:hypothetical protein
MMKRRTSSFTFTSFESKSLAELDDSPFTFTSSESKSLTELDDLRTKSGHVSSMYSSMFSSMILAELLLCSLGRNLRSFHVQLTRPDLFFRFEDLRTKSGHVSSMNSIKLLLFPRVLCFETLFDLGLGTSRLLLLPRLQLLIQLLQVTALTPIHHSAAQSIGDVLEALHTDRMIALRLRDTLVVDHGLLVRECLVRHACHTEKTRTAFALPRSKGWRCRLSTAFTMVSDCCVLSDPELSLGAQADSESVLQNERVFSSGCVAHGSKTPQLLPNCILPLL